MLLGLEDCNMYKVTKNDLFIFVFDLKVGIKGLLVKTSNHNVPNVHICLNLIDIRINVRCTTHHFNVMFL